MRTDLTPDKRLATANAHLDQLVASVRGMHSVQHLADQVLARPCARSAAAHTETLAYNLALALFRLAACEEEHVDAAV